ncbi:MAG TPA: glycoside hydrolase family 38 C-terminal domain-containing protein [Anaerolineae bacterium]|nr:glycoside hydrolase family 38 C-terminal domain-containing protein [Anaerolineae bacterium]HQI84975.1 glycoside hydrolase family 38 C-terminal domain-containing protein [Anaerolineae bacterium]
MTKNQILHMIGNAHIDPVWLWQWHEGFQEVLATFRSALDRMNEDPDFRFTASSAAFYAWVEAVDPAMFAEIQARVAEGRWDLAGGWWIEPDCNLPCGESFVRQALYGQRYFLAKFGKLARVGYAIDSFGHNGMLPQLLKKAGLDSYVFLRPGPHEKSLPGRLFWWESDDGSRVLAFRIPFEYLSWGKDVEIHARRCAAEMQPPVDEFACFYGVGNHGGGPTRENIASIHRLDALPDMPRLVFSTLGAFFDAARAKDWPLPVVHDELQKHASGCYAAHSGIKRWNRQAENALLRAEKWAAIANRVAGLPYPPDFERAWRSVLFNQFHDIMAGTSIAPAYDDARAAYGEALTIADRAFTAAAQALAWRMTIPHEDGVKPVVVFNPHTWAVQAPVELEVGSSSAAGVLTDETGVPVAMQPVQSRATAGGRARISFVADLPPLGYRVYRLSSESAPPDIAPVQATATTLENDRLRLTFDPATGFLVSLYDKDAALEVLAGPAARPVVLADTSDTWSHAVFRFDQICGEFTATRMRVIEQGPVKAVLRVESAWGQSRLAQDFTLYRELPRVDVHVTVDWHEQFKVLKLRFPVNVSAAQATHAIPYGHIARPATGDEEPIQDWVDVSGAAQNDARYGLSLLNDGKYSVDVAGSNIGLTVLRSPIYAHHIPAEPHPERDYEFIDQGEQRFTYSLFPHRGSWEEAGTTRQAVELNQPPFALIATGRPTGTLPLRDAFISVNAANILVTAFKQAEDGAAADGGTLILRAYESIGAATHATLSLPHWARVIAADFGPCEIKTFRIPHDPAQPVTETNLLEMPEYG